MTNLTRDEIHAARDRGAAFCKEHLVECCRELVEWSDTAVLCDGKVRELARIFSYAEHGALALAEAEIKHQALVKVAGPAEPKDTGRIMMSAHALCPTDMSHPDRMRWMADYFLARYTGAPIKDHVIRETVDQLTTIAQTYGATGQLRDRIARIITPLLKPEHPYGN